jgi:hypothetical protein
MFTKMNFETRSPAPQNNTPDRHLKFSSLNMSFACPAELAD